MTVYRHKHTFNAGELSPLMYDVTDFDRHRNGCKKLYNMVCATQGAAVRRPGTKFIYNLNDLGLDPVNPIVREIPFIFNRERSYALIFFKHVDGCGRIVFGTTNSDGTDGLILGSGTACSYTLNYYINYTGYDDYTIRFPLLTVLTAQVVHIPTSGANTTLEEDTHYTIAYNTVSSPSDGLPYSNAVITVTAGLTGITTGRLQLRLTVEAPVISTSTVVSVIIPNTWDIENFDYAQSADIIYFTQSGIRPYTLKRYDHQCWLLEITPSFTNEPSSWTTNNWPQRVTFHQQRLVFAATALNPKTVWATRAGDFASMAINTGSGGTMLDSDAITFTLDSGKQSAIQWISSGKALLIGTLDDEWTVIGNNQTALTPSNILAQRQTNNGSESLKTITVGLTTMFVERHGRVVNEFVYDYAFDSYKTTDMSILSPHMTDLYSITAWAYQQTPGSIIWCIREDGDLLGITYQRQHKVVGWHHHATNGAFKAITTIPGNTREDDVWFVVKRVINGEDVYYVEKLADYFLEDEAEWGRFSDSYIEYLGTAINSISVPHLIGEEVELLLDGMAYNPIIVPDDGVITLEDYYNHIVVGLAYESEVRPLLSDPETPEGSTLGRTQRITKTIISFYKTLGGIIGSDSEENGIREEELPFRKPSHITGQAVPLFSGLYEYDYMEGFDLKAEYYIKQRQPLPLTILSVVDEFEVYD